MTSAQPDYFSLVGQLIGGLGLFILAMKLMTEGLKIAVAEGLRDVLGRWTSTPLKGIATGAAITVLVQSSSAVTIATIGFVNASMLSLHQALGIVFGANVGTTATGWLVSLVGFNLKVEAFALPLIGIGTGLWLMYQERRLGGVGEAILGFGLFFLGLEILKAAFDGLAPSLNLQVVADYGALGVVLLVGVGMLMTVLTQSSSAAIAITLTAAVGGVISVPSAAAVVIGANVGTTSTALFASIGATPAAKRVAMAHVLFNGITGVLALALLPLMLWIVDLAEGAITGGGSAALSLALFHTVFNVLGVLVLAPFSGRLSAFLETRFRSEAEDVAKLRFLDKNVLQTPVLAIDALCQELERAASLARECAGDALASPATASGALRNRVEPIKHLREAIVSFASDLGRSRLPEDVMLLLPLVLRTAQTVEDTVNSSIVGGQSAAALDRLADPTLKTFADDFLTASRQLVDLCGLPLSELSRKELKDARQAVEDTYKALRSSLLEAGLESRVTAAEMNAMLDHIIPVRRLARRVCRLSERLIALRGQVLPKNQHADQPSTNGGTGRAGQQSTENIATRDDVSDVGRPQQD